MTASALLGTRMSRRVRLRMPASGFAGTMSNRQAGSLSWRRDLPITFCCDFHRPAEATSLSVWGPNEPKRLSGDPQRRWVDLRAVHPRELPGSVTSLTAGR